MRLISIRKYLNSGQSATDAEMPDCAPFCLGLMEQIGEVLDGDARWESLRREWAEADRGALAEEYTKRAGETLRLLQQERSESSRKQASEMQNLLIALNQALLSMADRSEHGVKQLRQIEVRLRAATQVNDLGTLKAALRDTIDFVAAEANRQRQETSALLERMDKDMAQVRSSALSSSLSLPGRDEAVASFNRLCSSSSAHQLLGVVTRFGSLRLLAGRYSAALAEDVVWRAAQAFRPLAMDHRIYRWHSEALAWVVEARPSASAARLQLEATLGQPWEHRGIANGRTVLLSVPLTWMSVLLSESPAPALVEQIDRFCPAAPGA